MKKHKNWPDGSLRGAVTPTSLVTQKNNSDIQLYGPENQYKTIEATSYHYRFQRYLLG